MEKETIVWDFDKYEDSIEIKNSILSKEAKAEKNIEKVTNEILKLDTSTQLNVILCILNDDYILPNIDYEDYKDDYEYYNFIEKMLAQKCFKENRNVIYSVINDERESLDYKTISDFEEKYNINIIYSEK
jgi:hypothetical protein